MRKSAANDDVMSTRDAAERLGVALRTVQLWVESGVLPAWKTAGGHRRIAKSAVEKLMEERRVAIGGNSAKADTPQPFRILVVEDEPDLLRLFTMVIEDWGLPVEMRTATNGFEALVRIGEQCPDLMITDLNMPGMDGFRMIRSLRNFGEGLETLEIVVVTALGPQDIENRGGLPEGVRVFIKPVPFAELEQLVRERLQTETAAPLAD
jgi:excisionase family DNA binding protein